MRRLEELTTLTDEEKRMLLEVKQAILRHEPAAEVILYGSAARGEQGPESDYDVLVVLPERPSRETEDRVRIAAYDAAFDYDFVVSVMVYGRDEWGSPLQAATPYHGNVAREGVRV
jgi:predicted nucleotidyltransferase